MPSLFLGNFPLVVANHFSHIVENLESGDPAAFESIYNLYWEEVYLSALKRVQDEDIAKEITQELFISLWEKREILRINESLQAYLHGAVKYRVINYFRSAITRDRYHNHMQSLLGEQTINETESYYAVKAIKSTLDSILKKMPERMRLIFSMSRFEQKSITEIADELNLSGQTVKNQLTSALKIIRENGSLIILLILFISS
jgi:RNA polymerase sigma-70 factor (family 1)